MNNDCRALTVSEIFKHEDRYKWFLRSAKIRHTFFPSLSNKDSHPLESFRRFHTQKQYALVVCVHGHSKMSINHCQLLFACENDLHAPAIQLSVL